jgi:hypothetical protein
MTRVVLTFGLLAGAILSAMLAATVPFMDRIGFDRGEVIGYTSMVAAFLLIFFGVRSYRDHVGGGAIGFGRALAIGAMIAATASLCYAATWQVLSARMAPDFAARYQEHVLEKERARGASEERIEAKRAQMQRYMELYERPLFRVAITFIEPLPVGLIVALVSAGILRRREKNVVDTTSHTTATA